MGISSQVWQIYHAYYVRFDSSGRPVTAQIPSASAGQQSTQFSLGRGDRPRLSIAPINRESRTTWPGGQRSALLVCPSWVGPPNPWSRSARQSAACPAMHTHAHAVSSGQPATTTPSVRPGTHRREQACLHSNVMRVAAAVNGDSYRTHPRQQNLVDTVYAV
jgi:hypothetical protein